jgi:hypothetical protein
MLLFVSYLFKSKYSLPANKLLKKISPENNCLYKKPLRRIGMATNDCLPDLKSGKIAI